MKTIATFNAEGFTSVVTQDENNVIRFTADADIDADGANGQHGALAAYRADGHGSELLANGGMGVKNGKVVFTTSWGPDIAVADEHGNPLVLDGVIITRTAYKFRNRDEKDPRAYVDAQTVPYIVVPPIIRKGTKGVVLGAKAFAEYRGRRVECVVADVGPRSKVGEISIALAAALGIPSSPRSGGLESAGVKYEIHAGVPAVLDGVTYTLQRA